MTPIPAGFIPDGRRHSAGRGVRSGGKPLFSRATPDGEGGAEEKVALMHGFYPFAGAAGGPRLTRDLRPFRRAGFVNGVPPGSAEEISPRQIAETAISLRSRSLRTAIDARAGRPWAIRVEAPFRRPRSKGHRP